MDELYEINKRVIQSLCEIILDSMITDRLSPDVAWESVFLILNCCKADSRPVASSNFLRERAVNLAEEDYQLFYYRYKDEWHNNKDYLDVMKIKPRKATNGSLKKVMLEYVVQIMKDLEKITNNIGSNAYALKAFFDSYGLYFASAKTLSNWYHDHKKLANTYHEGV